MLLRMFLWVILPFAIGFCWFCGGLVRCRSIRCRSILALLFMLFLAEGVKNCRLAHAICFTSSDCCSPFYRNIPKKDSSSKFLSFWIPPTRDPPKETSLPAAR